MTGKYILLSVTLALALSLLAGCGTNTPVEDSVNEPIVQIDGTQIVLSDTEILVDNVAATKDETQAVYIANDIVYYEEGHDFIYGEGTEADAHSKEEADTHTVVHITQPGNYILTGEMSAGQIAIDLGKDSKEDPNAVVNLYLKGVDINNTVAPAVIFYNTYEPFNDVTEETATKDVETSSAGANVFIVDGTENNIVGSYVARIYKSDSVILSEDGKSVEDAKKLHKYDAAFYSKTTMNINGYNGDTGVLNIKAANEGLGSEMHLTINGGIINIESGNDGINTNEDYISVTTVNGGNLNIFVNGSTGEGDGIDSNGWLVINQGIVTAEACGLSMDSGIDSDMGIHINGGTVIASGNMLDRISESNQTYAVLNFREFLGAGTYTLKNSDNIAVLEKDIENTFTSLIITSPDLVESDYTLWYNDSQLVGSVSENGGMFGGTRTDMGEMSESGMPSPPEWNMPNEMMPPNGFNGERPEMPEGFNPENTPNAGEDMERPKDKMDFETNEDGTITLPDGTVVEPSEFKNNKGQRPGKDFENMPVEDVESSETFSIKDGINYFTFIFLKDSRS